MYETDEGHIEETYQRSQFINQLPKIGDTITAIGALYCIPKKPIKLDELLEALEAQREYNNFPTGEK